MKKLIGEKQIEFNQEKYLKKFKIMPSFGTLFEPEWWRVKDGVCPLCFNKLRVMRDKPFYICSSPKHSKAFVVHEDRTK